MSVTPSRWMWVRDVGDGAAYIRLHTDRFLVHQIVAIVLGRVPTNVTLLFIYAPVPLVEALPPPPSHTIISTMSHTRATCVRCQTTSALYSFTDSTRFPKPRPVKHSCTRTRTTNISLWNIVIQNNVYILRKSLVGDCVWMHERGRGQPTQVSRCNT